MERTGSSGDGSKSSRARSETRNEKRKTVVSGCVKSVVTSLYLPTITVSDESVQEGRCGRREELKGKRRISLEPISNRYFKIARGHSEACSGHCTARADVPYAELRSRYRDSLTAEVKSSRSSPRPWKHRKEVQQRRFPGSHVGVPRVCVAKYMIDASEPDAGMRDARGR